MYVSGTDLACMKIAHDYEKFDKEIFLVDDLYEYANKVIKFVHNQINSRSFTLTPINVFPLNLMCDVGIKYNGEGRNVGLWTGAVCINRERYVANHKNVEYKCFMRLPKEILEVIYKWFAEEEKEFEKKINEQNLPAKSLKK